MGDSMEQYCLHCEWSEDAEQRDESVMNVYFLRSTNLMPSRAPVHGTATYRCDDTRDCIIQFCPPDDEHMCSKHVQA